MLCRWLPSTLMLGVGALMLIIIDSPSISTPVAIVSWATAIVLSPSIFPQPVSDGAARQITSRTAHTAEIPIVYWRPGCRYCIWLRLALGLVGKQAIWVDVSHDATASQRVRAVNGGNEVVPTVFIGTTALTNPPPAVVKAHLKSLQS